MTTDRRNWSRDELLVVFRLYCRTPFGRLHQRNTEIIDLAHHIGRTPGAVAMKACNFASLDPHQQARRIRALGNVSRADRELWESFAQDSEAVAQEAEAAFVRITGEEREEYVPELKLPQGPAERETVVRARRVQSFFRTAVLASYENRCALTGLAIPELLNASHIIPWSADSSRRADPSNGICLNALHDRAFDRGLLTFDDNLRTVLSSHISDYEESPMQSELLLSVAGRPLQPPVRFLPAPEALEYHRNIVFRF